MQQEEVIVIGAGPCGLSVACELQNIGIEPLIIEKGSLVHSIYGYPTFMQFFSTPELLEIGGVPFSTPHEKPSRQEALNYYRLVANRRQLRVRTYELVVSVIPDANGFIVRTEDRLQQKAAYSAKQVVIATGYFDHPNLLRVPGEQLPKVSHYFKDAHPYNGLNVAVVGGKNSAVDAAMELERAGANVTVIYRGAQLSESVKPWVRPVFESLLNKGRIRMLWNSRVVAIEEKRVLVHAAGEELVLDNDFVFALTGYHPDHRMLKSMGVDVHAETGAPSANPETMETNVPGLYIAGVIAAGYEANVIFIENGRLHGGWIARDIAAKRGQM